MKKWRVQKYRQERRVREHLGSAVTGINAAVTWLSYHRIIMQFSIVVACIYCCNYINRKQNLLCIYAVQQQHAFIVIPGHRIPSAQVRRAIAECIYYCNTRIDFAHLCSVIHCSAFFLTGHRIYSAYISIEIAACISNNNHCQDKEFTAHLCSAITACIYCDTYINR